MALTQLCHFKIRLQSFFIFYKYHVFTPAKSTDSDGWLLLMVLYSAMTNACSLLLHTYGQQFITLILKILGTHREIACKPTGPPGRHAYFDLCILCKHMLAKWHISGFPNQQTCQPKGKKKPNSTIIFYLHKIKMFPFTLQKRNVCLAFILFPFLLVFFSIFCFNFLFFQKGSTHLPKRDRGVCTFLNSGK